MTLSVNPDEVIHECSYLWDKAYKMAVHSVGVTDWSRATHEQKKSVDITQCVLFSRINSRESMLPYDVVIGKETLRQLREEQEGV